MPPETPEQHALRFPKLTHAQIIQVTAASTPRRVDPGEILFDQLTADHGIFVALTGSLEIVGVSNGVESILTVLLPGEFTGEVTQLSGRRNPLEFISNRETPQERIRR
jgi:thioredoxin reductase (NADPH)